MPFSNIRGLNWFFDEVRPLLKINLRVLVAGNISNAVRHLPGVTYIDYVEDIGEAYARCSITINPLQDGTGMKVKAVESMSYGVPIVSTPRGLCGFSPDILHHFIVAEDPQKFACQVERLLSDRHYYQGQCELMLSLFKLHFNVSATTSVLKDVFTSGNSKN